MRRIIFLAFSLFCLHAAFGQVQFLGTPTTKVQVQGTLEAKKGFYNSNRDTTFTPDALGIQVYRAQDSSIYVSVAFGGKKWQKVGTSAIADVDLSPYLLSSNAAATYQAKGNYALSSQLPTNLNQLTNGPGYITSSALSPYLLSSTASSSYQPIGSYATTSQLNAKASQSALVDTAGALRTAFGTGVGVTDGSKVDIQVLNGGTTWRVKDTVLKGQNFKNDEKDTVGLELLVFDDAPTSGSVNAPTSGSVYNALQGKAPVANPVFTGTVKIVTDTVATNKYVRDNASTRLYDDLDYTTNGVYALDARQGKTLKGMIDVVTATVGTKAPIDNPQFTGTQVRWGADTVATRAYARANGGGGTGVTTGSKNQINVVNASTDWQINSNVITPAMLSSSFTTVLNVLDTTLAVTNATPITVYSYTPANAEGVTFEVRCEALNTSTSDAVYGAKKSRRFLYNGTLTAGAIRNIDADEYTGSTLSTATFTITTSGSNVIVQFTGEASKNIKAHFTINITKVTSAP